MKRYIYSVLFVLVLFFVFVPVVFAQTGDPQVDNAISEAAKAILLAVVGLVTLPWAAPFTTLMSNIFKRFLPTTIGGGAIHLAVSVVVWLLFCAATKFGYGVQFQQGIDVFYRLLVILAPLLGLVGTGQTLYAKAKARGWAGFGWERSQLKLAEGRGPSMG